MTSSTFAQSLPERLKVSLDAKATRSVVSDVLLPHELRLVQRGHPQRGRRQVRFQPHDTENTCPYSKRNAGEAGGVCSCPNMRIRGRDIGGSATMRMH